MRVIHLHHPYNPSQINNKPIVLAMGYFDGVHLGHQEVLRQARQLADIKGLPLAAMTFNQPAAFIFQEANPSSLPQITSLREKEELMDQAGVDILYVVEMTSQFVGLAPQDFVDQYMVALGAKYLVAGFDYTYGKKDIANMARLGFYSQGRFEIVEVPAFENQAGKISSRHIRQQLEAGQIELANESLGYPYFFYGRVIHGEKRGRTLGFPTANIASHCQVILPKEGVYLVKCQLLATSVWGLASVGRKVTFGDDYGLSLEIYLLDFSQEIYGEEMRITWYHYLRPELKFSSVDDLIVQMNQDEDKGRLYIADLEEA
ncbi:bifunctional riboflavin kinase/FMN adenylyltransferase [Aerococcus urinaehominis]|uniref:Riboflavin biosynthesis protein n=1 Tax=Aerococcus urinaehominis TaxID=128944 RepID=A0A0X8FKC2_9LACT|nr:riboflavin biosynthesis protein RibF [Aerococcus urinaehominis]AMB98817.1 bifunctional riboflavin kinase/FMN adenylyltransferase [Aerococcus urinaehominis]SDM49125.1 riboflavin kinase / FMN adenylyltransferase [Aerococcus urinaehominis]